MWIFGYGSLIWRPSFPFTESRHGLIRGWSRRFWQGSPDHRGTPEAPGRVVTLIPAPDDACFGRAFRIPPADAPAILDALDIREQGGYEQHTVPVFAPDTPRHAPFCDALLYIASADNPHFLGPAPVDTMARHILASHGPSGPNTEYLLRLDDALRAMNAPDPHVHTLADRVRGLAQANTPAS